MNFPLIIINGDVATSLNRKKPNWIEISNKSFSLQCKLKRKISVLLKGGYDLSQVGHYLKAYNIHINNETNYMAGKISIHNDHSISILNSLKLSLEDKSFLIEHIPFIDSNYFKTEIFEFNYDVFVFSVLMDYTQEVYQHKTRNFKITHGGYFHNITDNSERNDILDYYKKSDIREIDASFLNWFKNNFVHIGQITQADFVNNLNTLRKNIPSKIPIIFINGAEQESTHPLEHSAKTRHIEMNEALINFMDKSKNNYLLDLRGIIKPENITNSIRHYDRNAYFLMAEHLKDRISEVTNNEIKENKVKKIFIKNKKILKQNLKAVLHSLKTL
ncbi:MAG: hypothetical protein ACJA2S_001165 [Cyclobacteriaceae bacterium]